MATTTIKVTSRIEVIGPRCQAALLEADGPDAGPAFIASSRSVSLNTRNRIAAEIDEWAAFDQKSCPDFPQHGKTATHRKKLCSVGRPSDGTERLKLVSGAQRIAFELCGTELRHEIE